MADDEQVTTPTSGDSSSDSSSDSSGGSSSGSSMIGRLLLVGFMGMVVVAECFFAYFWLPSAEEVAARTEEMVKEMAPEAKEEEQDGSKELVKEVELGEFTVTTHQTAGEATLRTEFRLFGMVAEDDESELTELLTRNKNRFRDTVIVEIRNSEVGDLTDARLGLIKRRILEKSNVLFGKPMLREVGFADFSFVEI